MALSQATAQKIVNVVANEVDCWRAIHDGVFSNEFFSKLKLAGDLRNIWFIVRGREPDDPEFSQKMCVGIAQVTSQKISTVAEKMSRALHQEPLLEGVSNAVPVHRVVNGIHHEATKVQMTDGTDYVMDWFQTLDVMNPVMYLTSDWRKGEYGVMFCQFFGFDGPYAALAPGPGF